MYLVTVCLPMVACGLPLVCMVVVTCVNWHVPTMCGYIDDGTLLVGEVR